MYRDSIVIARRGDMASLTRNEEIVLVSILKLRSESYGIAIKNQIGRLTGEDWNYGLLYCALDQLVKKGYLVKREGKPVPERGGRRKMFYSISPSGRQALAEAYDLKRSLWEGIGRALLEGETAG
jgi:PadR family transcriptional regulator PadR